MFRVCCVSPGLIWSSEDNLPECQYSGDPTQVTRLGNKGLHLLSHLTKPDKYLSN